MNNFIIGILGGFVPATLMLFFYLLSFAGRFAALENDIKWLKKVISECLPH